MYPIELACHIQCGISEVKKLAQAVLDHIHHNLQVQLLILMYQCIAESHHRLQPVHLLDRHQPSLL